MYLKRCHKQREQRSHQVTEIIRESDKQGIYIHTIKGIQMCQQEKDEKKR